MSAVTVAALLAGGYLLGRTRPGARLSRWNERELALSKRGSRARNIHALLFTVLHPITTARIMREERPAPIPVAIRLDELAPGQS